MSTIRLALSGLDATAALGGVLAELARGGKLGVLLLYGDLGAGKTTLTRHIVENLPGGEAAEVSSPSFTLCNEYPTRPKVLHFDLYRSVEGRLDENLLEALESVDPVGSGAGHTDGRLIIVEWAERICPCEMGWFPDSYLACHLTEDGNKRTAKLASHGADAALVEENIKAGAARCGLELLQPSARGS